MDRNCTACNLKRDKDKHERDTTIFKNCYNKKKMKNNNFISEKDVKDISSSNKQIKDDNSIVSTSEFHRHVTIGPSNVGNT